MKLILNKYQLAIEEYIFVSVGAIKKRLMLYNADMIGM